MTADELALFIVLLGAVVLLFAIRGSVRRGPTLSERYKTASPEERALMDQEIARKPWLGPFVLPLSAWSIVLSVLSFLVLHFWLRVL